MGEFPNRKNVKIITPRTAVCSVLLRLGVIVGGTFDHGRPRPCSLQ
jgi:hypothetical protein